MKDYRINITPFAVENIKEAYEHLELENPGYAVKWLSGIREAILKLETLPESHAPAPESDAFDCDVRQLLFGRGTPWRIFFTIGEKTVHILHIHHGRRDYW